MEKYLAWVVYLFGVIGGDITVMVYYALVVGWDGLPAIAGALFCSSVGVVPTLAATRGNSPTFKALNYVLCFALAGGCVFAGITGFKLIRGQKFIDAEFARELERGKQIKNAALEARKTGMRSRDAAEVAKATASAVSTQAGAIAPTEQELVKEPAWFPWLPWVNGGATAVFVTILMAAFWKAEDKNKDGKPDFMQKQGEAEDRPQEPQSPKP